MMIALLVATAQILTSTAQGLRFPPPPNPDAVEKPAPPPGVFRVGPGVTAPQLIKDVKPMYRADAMRNKVQGRALLEAVVNIDGSVGDVRVVRSLDQKYGMDDEAVECVKKWRFKPGLKDGMAVPVLVEIEMAFTLR